MSNFKNPDDEPEIFKVAETAEREGREISYGEIWDAIRKENPEEDEEIGEE